jgi:PAS domain S-box-containing protein
LAVAAREARGVPDSDLAELRRRIGALEAENERLCRALAGDEERLQATLARATDYAILTTDADGRLTSWNEGARHVLGWEAAEALGQPFAMIFTPEDREAGVPEREMSRAARDGHAADVRWHMRRDGTRFWGQGQVMPLRGSGTPGFLKILRDHTAQHEHEAALRASEERLRLAMEAGSLHAFDLDLASDHAARSPQHDTLFGYTEPQADWGYAAFLRHVVEEDRAAVEQSFRKALESGTEWRLRCRIRRASDGMVRWIGAHGMPLHRPDGQATRMLGVVTDVTDQAKITEELQRLNETLETEVTERTRERDRIWRNSQDLLVVIDPGGVFQSGNPAWRTILGYNPAKLAGGPFPGVVHPDDVAATAAAIERASAGPIGPFENRCRHKDGSYRWFSWTAAPEDNLIYGIGRDVTAEKSAAEALRNAEEQLRQSQKMEAVGQLTGGIAHDFNNLLTAVVGSLELITRRPDDRERVRRLAQAAYEAAMRGAKLTGQLLAFSRTQQLLVVPVDVNGLLAGMEELLTRSVAPLVAVQLDLDAESGLALADANQLELAILNLAINARDAMPDGGTIRIATAPVAWRGASGSDLQAGDYVEVTVGDTGTGMSEAVRARAFEPFFTTKSAGHGTGLGLAQVYGIARQAGGAARIESAPGQGTLVRLLLPRAPEPELQQPGVAREGTAGGDAEAARPAPTVLVVDDDPDVRRFLGEMLETLGYRVLLAADGEAGLRLLDADRPDLLLVDFAMPGMNGAEVAQAARARYPTLPVAFATGYADTAVLEAAQGEAPVLRKPFALAELEEMLARLLAGG